MDREKIIQNLDRAFWDVKHDPEALYLLLMGQKTQDGGMDRDRLFRRLLETYNWYTLLDMVPPNALPDLLSPKVTGSLRNASLRERYDALARVLYP